MIRLAFTIQRKIIRIEIENKVVRYYDDNWKDGVQVMPSQTPEMKLMIRKMLLSRKPSIKAAGLLIVDVNSGKNLDEYKKCKTDDEVAEIIRKDCLLKGYVEVK